MNLSVKYRRVSIFLTSVAQVVFYRLNIHKLPHPVSYDCLSQWSLAALGGTGRPGPVPLPSPRSEACPSARRRPPDAPEPERERRAGLVGRAGTDGGARLTPEAGRERRAGLVGAAVCVVPAGALSAGRSAAPRRQLPGTHRVVYHVPGL